MQRTVLITGGTGTLGSELVSRFATDPNTRKILVLTRAPAPTFGSSLPRVEMIQGDIRREPDLGLSRSARELLHHEVTDLLHCAGSTAFTLPLEDARAINVGGTLALMRFAAGCRLLERIGCFSTVYVAGRRTGAFSESDLNNEGTGFVNSYEQSKYEMEQALRGMMGALPIAVFRLSTIVGHSVTGSVPRFTGFHHALRLLYQGLAPMVPGSPDQAVDLVSVDYAADAACWLFQNRFAAGRTFHLCAGPARSNTLEEVVNATIDAFHRFRPVWRKRSIEKPVFANLETYELFVRSVEEAGNQVLREATRVIQAFAYQLGYPKRFDSARTDAELSASGVRFPPLLAYYPKVVRHCLETNWGAAA